VANGHELTAVVGRPAPAGAPQRFSTRSVAVADDGPVDVLNAGATSLADRAAVPAGAGAGSTTGPTGGAAAGAGRLARSMVPLSVAAVVVLRLPYLWAPLSADEGGFLAVGAQWHRNGSSLYGDYWVDRPPLLIAVFQLAAWLGELPALRLIGCAVAALTVWLAAAAAGNIAGGRARAWTAVVTAALLCSPLLGVTVVNGELLAAPLVAGTVALATRTLRSATGRREALWSAVGAGVLATAAVLVKQNMADGAVFAVALWCAALLSGHLGRRRCWLLLLCFGTGAVGCVLAVAGFTVAHGTSPGGVLYAMYPFRIEAARVIAARGGTLDAARFHSLLTQWLLSAVPLVLTLFAWHVARRRMAGPGRVALVVLAGFATLSVLAGGNYWSHYLVETIVPVGICAGVLMHDRLLLARVSTAVLVAVAAVSWATGLTATTSSSGVTVGRSVAAVAHPGDTVLSAFGNADIVESSGLRSPYPYLWSLPTHTLDPALARLDRILVGPAAPTWLVLRGPTTHDFLTRHTGSVLATRYHLTTHVCGRAIYLRNGVTRGDPRQTQGCRASLLSSMRAGR
jgi:hypothetical protein